MFIQGISRREWLAIAGMAAVPANIGFGFAAAETGSPSPLNRLPRMVQESLIVRLRNVEQAALARKGALRTRSDAEAYIREVRQKIRQCFGPLPEKSPLRPQVTGILERDMYRIEKVIFESRPGFLVTANLYIPKGRKFPLPGVVGTCGHTLSGKAAAPYQSFGQALARLGYVALVFDPLGQGERSQYTGQRPPLAPVYQHLMAGNQQVLVGESLSMWRAWDGIRALDYLLSRPEVDPRHVGVTGTSGGGTSSTWMCALDSRWTMAAPSCFITTFRRNLENEIPADPEQYPPKALALGLDHDDFLAVMAPKPVVILANEKDFFDIRGAEEAYQRLRKLYRLLGAEENLALHVAPTEHGFSKENREGMYRWFNRVTGASKERNEPTLVIEKEEALWCTPKGQVDAMGSRPVSYFTRQKSERVSTARGALKGEALVNAVGTALKLPPRSGSPEFRILRPEGKRGYPLPASTTYMVETEPGIHAVVSLLGQTARYSRPSAERRRAILYVAHQSSDAELRSEQLVGELVESEPDAAFYACDVRGIGESKPNTCGKEAYSDAYGSDYFYAGHGLMLDYPVVGQRTHDVLRVLDWLALCGHTEVHLAAKGWGAVPATFAALLSRLVVRVTLKNAPASYSEIAQAETYGWPLALFVPNVLASFDLPDCYAALKAKDLRQVELSGRGDH